MSKIADFLFQLLLAFAASSATVNFLKGDKIDIAILFLILIVGYRVAALHNKVDKLLESKDNAPIK